MNLGKPTTISFSPRNMSFSLNGEMIYQVWNYDSPIPKILEWNYNKSHIEDVLMFIRDSLITF